MKKPTKKQSEAIDSLYTAVQNYIEAHGGSLILIGGTQIQQFPEDGKFKFRLAIRCTGRKPDYANKDTKKEGGE